MHVVIDHDIIKSLTIFDNYFKAMKKLPPKNKILITGGVIKYRKKLIEAKTDLHQKITKSENGSPALSNVIVNLPPVYITLSIKIFYVILIGFTKNCFLIYK